MVKVSKNPEEILDMSIENIELLKKQLKKLELKK